MCCSWTIVGSSGSSSGGAGGGSRGDKRYQDMSYVTNVVLAEHMRQKIRRDLSRWSRKLLLCLGLENIGKHIVGDSKWEKLYDGCPSSSSTAEQDPEDTSADFEPQVRDDDTTPTSGKSPSALDTSSTPTVQSVQVDVGGGEDVEEDETTTVVEQAGQVENGKVNEICDAREDKDGDDVRDEEENDEEEMECRRRDELEANDEVEEEEAMDKDEIETSTSSPQQHISRRLSKMDEGEMGMIEREEIENEEDEVEGDREDVSGHQSPMSTSPSRQARGVGGLMDRPPESPNSGSEAAQSTEEKGPGGGGALVDNLFQILPYWYFLNRAFGMPGGADGGLGTPLGSSMVDGQGDGEEEDDDGGGSSTADGGGGQDSGRGSSPFGVGGGQSSAATQRLNSLLLLESLRQQLQNQGQQGLLSQEQTLQQQLQISELLTRMSGGGGDVEGRNITSCLPTLQRGQPPIVSDNHHQGNASLRPASVEPHDIDDQPLDLTSCRTNRDDEKVGNNYADYPAGGNNAALNHHIAPFVLDEQTSKVFRSNPRSSKGYTAQELQAALHDIQSGKLGTRRAAVIYGIPRSTLRNKVYKLGKDRGRLFGATGTAANQNHNHLNNNNNNNTNNNNNNNNNSKDSLGNASLLGKLSYFHGLTAASSYLSGGGANRGAPPASRYNNMEEDDGEEATPPPSTFLNRRAPPSLYAMGNGDVSPPKHLPAAHLHHPHQSSLSQLISKHAHQQRTTFHQNYQSSPMDVAMMEESSCHSDDHGPTGTPLLTHHKDSWKYALARHQEQQQQLLSQQQRQAVGGANHFQRQPSHQQQQAQQNHSGGSGGGGGDDGSSSLDLGKKSRPKRGKYRNYDREALIKAVRAVQNGEMSVHRAGSFFGVPHSTLEYKVKERHLLRRPKRKDVTSPLSQTKSSSPESSSQDAATPNTAAARHGAFAKGPAAAKSLINNNNNNNNNNNSSAEGGGLHHPYMFPLTSDLRESLSRYLSKENSKAADDDRASSAEIMDTGASGQHDPDDDDDDEPSLPESHRLHHQLTQKSSSSGKSGGGGAAALALEGLIGNRLSNLFQLNDILLRSGSAGGGGGGEGRPENLLDLSKK